MYAYVSRRLQTFVQLMHLRYETRVHKLTKSSRTPFCVNSTVQISSVTCTMEYGDRGLNYGIPNNRAVNTGSQLFSTSFYASGISEQFLHFDGIPKVSTVPIAERCILMKS